MNPKQAGGALLLAAATAIITFSATKWAENSAKTIEAGETAQVADIVRDVIQAEMKVHVNGEEMTYGEVISSIDHRLTTIERDQSNMKEALQALSED